MSSIVKDNKSTSDNQDGSKSDKPIKPGGLSAWYCSSRWLMAHHDPFANINTTSSHLCLADLHGEGENLLALVDFKRTGQQDIRSTQPPYDCRIRIYRGQQLIYNHFLDDLPSSLVVSSIQNTPVQTNTKQVQTQLNQMLLTVTINDDMYFYKKMKPSHKLSLEDDASIMKTLVKSEVEAWDMVRQNKVDTDALRELLESLSQELGSQELTCHTKNFLALKSSDERRAYLLSWKLKRVNGRGEHIMSFDTICCSAPRHKFPSSGSWQSYTMPNQVNILSSGIYSDKFNHIVSHQRDGLVVGTEDRHLIVFELFTNRGQIESHHRLPSVPDHILVEPYRSLESIDAKIGLGKLTYKILVSCRNSRIYSIQKGYISANDTGPNELLALKCNVVQMCWSGDYEEHGSNVLSPFFIVACLNHKVYCFSSINGYCRWVITAESPVTSLVNLNATNLKAQDMCLIGVASQSNRIDFYTSTNGRIMDSIYFSNDYCQAMTFGRYGREDNCLVVTTNSGHLLLFILKRTAKFSHGQCLSSAASYASEVLSKFGLNLRDESDQGHQHNQSTQKPFNLNEPAELPSAFSLSKSGLQNSHKTGFDSFLELEHDCDQTIQKNALDSLLTDQKLQIPSKSRDFVDNIVDQSHHSIGKLIFRLKS